MPDANLLPVEWSQYRVKGSSDGKQASHSSWHGEKFPVSNCT